MTTRMLRLRRANTDEDLASCRRIRQTVFVEEQGIAPEDEWDALDETSEHWLLLDDDRAVGTARVRAAGARAVKVQRVAVLQQHRRRGVGRSLMDAIETRAASSGADAIQLSAQRDAVPFYVALGYAAEGPPHQEAGIAHQRMVKRIAVLNGPPFP